MRKDEKKLTWIFTPFCRSQQVDSKHIWKVFLTTEQFQGRNKNKNSVSKKLTKKILKYTLKR